MRRPPPPNPFGQIRGLAHGDSSFAGKIAFFYPIWCLFLSGSRILTYCTVFHRASYSTYVFQMCILSALKYIVFTPYSLRIPEYIGIQSEYVAKNTLPTEYSTRAQNTLQYALNTGAEYVPAEYGRNTGGIRHGCRIRENTDGIPD